VLLIALAILLVTRLTASGRPPATPTPTPIQASAARGTAPARRTAVTGPITGTAPISGTARLAPTAVVVTPTIPVTIALGTTAAGTPVSPATTFHGAHVTLWAFVTLPHVRAGDTVRIAWRDLDRRATVENFFKHPQADAAPYYLKMFAFPGNTPTTPFAPGHYRVDVFRNTTLVASGSFRVVNP